MLPGKWVYDDKYNADSNHLRTRAHWVVCGNFDQIAEDNYNIYSAVANQLSVQILFIIIAIHDLECWQYDFVTAYLNAKIPGNRVILMQQPKGLKDSTGRVCQLQKALYGLRRSAKWWFNTLTPVLGKYGFESINSNCCIFRYRNRGIIILLYVDNMLIAAPTTQAIHETRNILMKEFEIKELGPAQLFLGLQITRNRTDRTVYLTQEGYVDKILAKFGKTDLNPVTTPYRHGLELPARWEPLTDQTDYISQTASLNFLSYGTRPDITFTVNKLSQANKGPSKEHVELLQHLWHYIKGTKALGIKLGGKYNPQDLELKAYSNAAFADDLFTQASTGRYVVFLAGGPILWQSKRQSLVTISTTEAEFVNLTPTARSLLWVAQMLKDFDIGTRLPRIIYTDSQNACLTVLNPVNQARTRHIDLRYKWVIECVQKHDFAIVHVSTHDMVADGLTKALQRIRHAGFVKQLGLLIAPKAETD